MLAVRAFFSKLEGVSSRIDSCSNPYCAPLRAEKKFCGFFEQKFSSTAHQIGMDVGFKDVGDGHLALFSQLE